MTEITDSQEMLRSDPELAQMVARVAQVVKPDAIVCVTKSGAFVKRLVNLVTQTRIIAASTDRRYPTDRAGNMCGYRQQNWAGGTARQAGWGHFYAGRLDQCAERRPAAHPQSVPGP